MHWQRLRDMTRVDGRGFPRYAGICAGFLLWLFLLWLCYKPWKHELDFSRIAKAVYMGVLPVISVPILTLRYRRSHRFFVWGGFTFLAGVLCLVAMFVTWKILSPRG
jgi:hypothetical protein